MYSRNASPPAVGTHQVRKRRRPALSCLQCRRRKVKCDRKVPCSNCVSSKHITCEYGPEATQARVSKFNGRTPLDHMSSSVLSNQQGGVSKPREDMLFNQLVTTSDPHSQPMESIPQRTVPLMQSPSRHTSELTTPSTSQSNQSVQELKDRVQQLENIVSRSINSDQSPNSSYGAIAGASKVRGSVKKSKCFGLSHWMILFEEVGSLCSLPDPHEVLINSLNESISFNATPSSSVLQKSTNS